MDGFEDIPEEPTPIADKRDLYANLGVSRNATDDAIKKAYRALAQVAHPDKHSSSLLREAASGTFGKINEAYEILSDVNRRKIYDVYGMAGLNAGLEVGRKHKSLAEITEEFQRAKAKEAREVMEQRLNFRGAYGFSFSAAHLFDKHIAHRRAVIARRRGQLASGPWLDLNGLDFNSVFDVPTWKEDTTAYVGAQGQMSRGAGAGGLVLGLRKTASEHTSWEAAIVTGSSQSAASLHVQRVLSEHAVGHLAYSFSGAQGGLGLEVGCTRALYDQHTKGHLTWNVGPVGGLTTGAQRVKNKTSWKFDVSVGPRSTGVAGFIARRLSKLSTLRFGLRFGTNAIDFDVGLLRKMNRETSVGMSVSIGIRGVHVKFRFNHVGQRFQFPILISPRATPRSGFLFLTIPFVVVGVLNTYVVAPYALRLENDTKNVLRQKYSAQVTKDKKEATAAQALLQSAATARLEKERQKNGLVVTQAAFGNFPRRARHKPGDFVVDGFFSDTSGASFGDGDTGTSSGDGNGDRDTNKTETKTETKTKSTSTREPPWLDVTTATRFMVFDSHLDVNAQAHKPSLLGFCDPCPDERKFLRVRYTYKGVLHEVTIGEDDALAIPNKTHQLPEECQK